MDTLRNTFSGLLAVITLGPTLAWAQSSYTEVVRRPVYETHYEPRQQITYEQVQQTRWRTETTTRWEPVTRTERVVVDEGRWERVWVPKLRDWDRVWVPQLVEREETRTTYEKRTLHKRVPYQVTRTVPVTTTRYEPVVTRRIVEEKIVRGHSGSDRSLTRTRSPLGRTASTRASRSSTTSRPAAIASRRYSSIPASRLGRYTPARSRTRAAFDAIDARVAARSGSGLSGYRPAARRPNVPTAAMAWRASDTLRR